MSEVVPGNFSLTFNKSTCQVIFNQLPIFHFSMATLWLILQGVKIRIVQSPPSEQFPSLDTVYLAQKGLADVRSLDITRLVGSGILHTKMWLVDGKHFYVGSANQDWRALTQVWCNLYSTQYMVNPRSTVTFIEGSMIAITSGQEVLISCAVCSVGGGHPYWKLGMLVDSLRGILRGSPCNGLYGGGSTQKGYIFHSSGIWKGRDFISLWKGRETCHLGI